MTFSLPGDTIVPADKMFWTSKKPAWWTLYITNESYIAQGPLFILRISSNFLMMISSPLSFSRKCVEFSCKFAYNRCEAILKLEHKFAHKILVYNSQLPPSVQNFKDKTLGSTDMIFSILATFIEQSPLCRATRRGHTKSRKLKFRDIGKGEDPRKKDKRLSLAADKRATV
jgi:hypothetical protein